MGHKLNGGHDDGPAALEMAIRLAGDSCSCTSGSSSGCMEVSNDAAPDLRAHRLTKGTVSRWRELLGLRTVLSLIRQRHTLRAGTRPAFDSPASCSSPS